MLVPAIVPALSLYRVETTNLHLINIWNHTQHLGKLLTLHNPNNSYNPNNKVNKQPAFWSPFDPWKSTATTHSQEFTFSRICSQNKGALLSLGPPGETCEPISSLLFVDTKTWELLFSAQGEDASITHARPTLKPLGRLVYFCSFLCCMLFHRKSRYHILC